MDSKILLEIFGYIGTALVIISMMMTSVLKLRAINICGGIISAIYSSFYGAWAVVIMNICLVIINIFQIIRQLSQKRCYDRIRVTSTDRGLQYFMSYHINDIKKFFPSFDIEKSRDAEYHMVYIEGEPAGVLVGVREGYSIKVEVDYATPKFRDLSVAKFLFPSLKEDGINQLVAVGEVEAHTKYLRKMGFEEHDGSMIKIL